MHNLQALNELYIQEDDNNSQALGHILEAVDEKVTFYKCLVLSKIQTLIVVESTWSRCFRSISNGSFQKGQKRLIRLNM